MRLRRIQSRWQVVIASIGSIALAIACSASKSVDSQSVAANNPVLTQPSAPEVGAAQEKTPCTLSLAAAPIIDGLKLGMTPDEVLVLFPGSKEDAEVRSALARPPSKFGVSSFLIRSAKYEMKKNFAGVSQITFLLLDGRVSIYTVQYNGPEYSHVDKFVERIGAELGLPPAVQWEAHPGMDNTLKSLKCAEFEVNAFIGGTGGNLNYILVKDLVADKELKQRRAKAREQASPTPSK